MTHRETAQHIETRAAEWVVRMDRGLSSGEQAALDEWLDGDGRRRGALLRARAVWIAAAAPVAANDARFSRLPRRAVLGAGLGMAAAVGAGMVIVPLLTRQRLTTQIGEIRRVPLADGSLAAINTDAAVEVDLGAKVRTVALQKGEAWFQVAKDEQRPFVVTAGQIRVRAVGTAFSVRRKSMGAVVMVTEGVVEVWSETGGTRRKVRAGEQVFVSNGAGATTPVSRPLEMERALAWRDGQIVLDGDTVAEAAAEAGVRVDRRPRQRAPLTVARAAAGARQAQRRSRARGRGGDDPTAGDPLAGPAAALAVYAGPDWTAHELHLVESDLDDPSGRPVHRTVETMQLGGTTTSG